MPPRQLLVHALVRKSGAPSDSSRFIPLAEFGLWQYAMANRHDIQVVSASLGVWLPDAEWARHAQLFAERERAPLSVDRVDVSLYDDTLGICHLVRRFARRDDLPALNYRLAQHLGPGDYRPEVSDGVFTGARPVEDLRRLARPIQSLAADLLSQPRERAALHPR